MKTYLKLTLICLSVVSTIVVYKFIFNKSVDTTNNTPISNYNFNKGKAASKKVETKNSSTPDSHRSPSSTYQSTSNRNFNNFQPKADSSENDSTTRVNNDNENYYEQGDSSISDSKSVNANDSDYVDNFQNRSPSAYYDQADGTLTNANQLNSSATNDESNNLGPVELGVLTTNSVESSETISTSPSTSSGSSSKTDSTSTASTPRIKGSVPPLLGIITTSTKSYLIEEAYSASTCTNPKITIFDIKTMTPLADNPITFESLTVTTNFEFNPTLFNLDLSKPTKYLLKTSGCDINYERIITSFYTDQNLTPTSTLVSKIIKSSSSIDLETIVGSKVEEIITSVDSKISPTDNFEKSYSEVENDSTIQNKFSDAFEGESYSILADAAPDISNLIIPSALQEKSAHTFSANTQHWNSNYITAFEWHTDNIKRSNLPTWNYTPSANSKRTETIKLLIGKATGAAGTDVDRNFPYHELTYNVTISDNSPTISPNFSLNPSTTNPTATANINIDISTGADQGDYYTNCESFSSFAVTQNTDIPSNDDFIYSCTTANTQTIPYTLTYSNGDIDLNVWAKDINGNISTKKTISINYDTTGPVINIIGIPSAARADSLFNLTWTVTESNQSSSNQHIIEYFNGSNWISLPVVASADGSLVNQSFSTTYTLPNIATSNAKFRVTLTDSVGNTASQETAQINVQRPSLAFSPTSLDFGAILNLSLPEATSLTISNTGNAATKDCSSANFSGPNLSEFEIIIDECSTSALEASDNCQIVVRPKPQTKGPKSSTLTWTCGLDSTSINLSYTSTNNSPVSPNNYAISTNEDTLISFNATPATDIDSDSLTYSIIAGPANGSLTNCMISDNDLSCDYTPNLNFNGTDSFSYKTNDGLSDSSNITVVTINVAPINDAPTLSSSQTVGVIEDTALNFNLNLGADVDGNTLTYIITQGPAAGSLSCAGGSSNACTYTPANNDINSYTFKYKVNDGNLDSSESTVTINISNTNDAPTMLADQTISTNEDTLVSFSLNGGSDIDVPSQTLSYKIITLPTNGTLSNCITAGSYSSDLTCDYTPNSNFNGTDSFTYRANDGVVDSASYSTVTINITAINDAPTLVTPQSFSTNEDTTLNFNLGSGNDVEGDTLTYTKLTNPASGTLSCVGGTSTSCTYTPVANYNGTVSFTYKTNDGSLDSNTATVNITVNAINDAPTLVTPQSFATNEDTVLNFNLGSGSDIEGSSLTYTKLTDPVSGTLTCTGGTSTACVYTPSANYHGTVSFTYKVNDGSLDSNIATVNITINSINDAPSLITPQAFATNEDTVLNFNLATGSDVEGDTLTYTKLTDPLSGTLSCIGGNSTACTYTPMPNYNGTVSFTYKTNDGSLDSNTATVNITVNSINDAPTLTTPQSFATNEDTVLNFNIAAGSDIEGNTLTYIKITDPSGGTLICAGGNSTACTFTPTANFNGETSFTYKVNDGSADSNVATVNITVNPINDTPIMASNQTFSTDDNTPLNFTITNAFDIDGDTLNYKLVSTPSNGSLSNCIITGSYGSDLTCTYQANTNFHGSDSFTYIANDGLVDAGSTATITINVSDKTPSSPPTIALAHSQYRNVTGQALTVSSCSDISEVLINEGSQPLAGDANWQLCSTTVGAITHTLETNTEGPRTLRAWSKDSHGNVSTTSNDLIVYYDITNPTIEFDMESFIMGGSVADVKFKLTEKNISSSQNIIFEYYNGVSWSTTNIAASDGPLIQKPYVEQVTTPNTNGQVLQFKITFTDLAGNQTISTANLTTDISKPTLSSLSINGGVTITNSGNVTSSLSASDSISKIIKFCFKIGNSTLPPASDKCWIRVDASSPGISPAQNISFSNYYILMGFAGGNYDIYAWVMDEAGNISDNSATLNTDYFAINFIPDNPPVVSDALAVNVDIPSNPPIESELIVSSGANLYVSWSASDVESLRANPISLKYSTDDVNFIDIPGGQNLLNAANGGCTLNGSFTGCTIVSAPTSSYFKVRVIAEDSEGTTVFYNTPVLNESKLRILAGNTEHGLNGSARTAIFYRYGYAASVAYAYKNKLVVSDDGKFFYIDPSRGLLWVNPSNGNLEVYIQKTGASSGDGGNFSSATLTHPSAIALDHQNRLLIWDSNRIRRIDLNTGIITTIIGGGAQTDPLTTVNSSDIALDSFHAHTSTFVPLPNGDIIFTAPTGSLHHRRYRAADDKVELINVTGQGVTNDSSYNWSLNGKYDLMFAYNTSTSAFEFMAQNIYRSFTGDSYPLPARIDYTAGGENSDYPAVAPYDLPFTHATALTGSDGKLYLIQRFRAGLRKYDPLTNTFDYVIGTGSYSTQPCPDGTAATACAVDIETSFVTKTGNIYFMDNGLLRTVDGSGNVITIFGQYSGFGDGVIATSARIGNVSDINLRQSSDQNTFVILDRITNKLREFEIDGNITNIASAGASWHGPFAFETDPTNGDVYIPRGTVINKIAGGSNTETSVVGGGSNQYHLSSSDGAIGSSINLVSGYSNETAGFVDGKIYYRKHSWASGSNYGCTLKAYDTTDSYRQSHIMGDSSATCSLQMTPGMNLRDLSTSGTFTKFRKIVDPNDSIEKEFFTNSGNSTLYTSLNGGPLTPFRTLPRGIGGFDYRYKDGNLEFFYCSGNKLYKYNYNTSTESQLTWSSTTITCSSSRIIYSSSRNSVIFGFHQNGLYGVAEYLLD